MNLPRAGRLGGRACSSFVVSRPSAGPRF